MHELPLFPLNTVLFPGMPLNLHIFEPRYKQMIHDCQENSPSFGVVLIKQGWEANGPIAEPHEFGCSVGISRVQILSEGRYNLLVVGQERFRILSVHHDRPYLVGNVDTQPLLTNQTEEVGLASQRLRHWFQKYILTLTQDREVDDTMRSIPADPVTMAYLAAEVLQIPPSHKQLFIEIGNCLNLIEELTEVYRREVALLDRIIHSTPSKGEASFSVN